MEYSKDLYSNYESYKNQDFLKRRFDLQVFYKKLEEICLKFCFEKEIVGQSVLGNPINIVKIGNGSIKIMLWSQMHGDEATATLALLDILNFFGNKNFDSKLKVSELTNKCSFLIIPILNPDGLVNWTRRNAQNIDINRDALDLQSPEGRLLKQLQFEYRPDFSFNLHDQVQHWAAGNTANQAVMAFLATAYDEAREINEVRRKAMKVIVSMNKVAQKFIPNKVGRFSDEFEPRAFGDNIQGWGSSLILVESGGNGEDYERQYVRKLHFVTLLSGFESIANSRYLEENIDEYLQIPENSKVLLDIIIRNAKIRICDKEIEVDLGIKRESRPISSTELKEYYFLDEFGDLSTFFGIKEIEAKKMECKVNDGIAIGEPISLELKEFGKIKFRINANEWQEL